MSTSDQATKCISMCLVTHSGLQLMPLRSQVWTSWLGIWPMEKSMLNLFHFKDYDWVLSLNVRILELILICSLYPRFSHGDKETFVLSGYLICKSSSCLELQGTPFCLQMWWTHSEHLSSTPRWIPQCLQNSGHTDTIEKRLLLDYFQTQIQIVWCSRWWHYFLC